MMQITIRRKSHGVKLVAPDALGGNDVDISTYDEGGIVSIFIRVNRAWWHGHFWSKSSAEDFCRDADRDMIAFGMQLRHAFNLPAINTHLLLRALDELRSQLVINCGRLHVPEQK